MSPQPDDPIRRISIEVPESFRRRLKYAVAAKGQDVSGWFREKGVEEIERHEATLVHE